MRRRDLLHNSKIKDFIRFAESKGYTNEITKGDFEVIRLKIKKNDLFHHVIGYQKTNCNHVTLTDEGIKLFYAMKANTND